MKFIASQVQINNLITLSLYQMLRNSEMCQLIIYDWRFYGAVACGMLLGDVAAC
jgi:hypothetical protein